ncbi:MAG: hypothetical protein Ct9H300mP28_24940 [Pseudomonadota bacterium]|nr:MAG: hypothetical protein Ct9H300mP28_24940 [Pseudomonadota bacterium]
MNFKGKNPPYYWSGKGHRKTIAVKLAESGLDIAIADMKPVVMMS